MTDDRAGRGRGESLTNPDDNELIRLRREKLDALRGRGTDPFGGRYPVTQWARGLAERLGNANEEELKGFGPVSLAGLFDGRRQLITYHFMWRHAESGFPGEDQGCPTCSFLADSIGHLSHLHACDTTLVLVSRAPIASIERFKKRMGWQVPC